MKMRLLVLNLILMLLVSACEGTDKTFMVGTLERDRVELKVETNEPIVAIHVVDGQSVNTGDLIIEQDPQRFEHMLAQQQALRDQAAARLAELLRGPRQETIEQARAQLDSTSAQRRNNLADYQRAKEVFARQLSSQSTLDTAETRWQTAVAAERAAAEFLSSLINGATVEELQQAQAAVDAQEAGLASAILNVERLKLYAPVSGVLDKRLYQLGERPLPGATVAIILDSARTYARIYVPENQRARIKPGDHMSVRIDGLERKLQGTVAWVSNDASFTPYFALTEHDRARLSYLAEIDLYGAESIPAGIPLEVDFPAAE
jgi:HlyD family secretion protein